MQKIVFEDTTVVKSPYVLIDGVEHEVINGTYQGGTDLNANTFNTMQDNIENAIDTVASDIPTVVDSLTGSSTTDAPSVHIVNSAISEINTSISNLIKTQTFSRNNITQPTGFDFWNLQPALSIPTGYSLIGFVVTQQPDNEKCLVSIDAGSGNAVYAKIYNGGSSNVSGDVSGKAIFIKNS